MNEILIKLLELLEYQTWIPVETQVEITALKNEALKELEKTTE